MTERAKRAADVLSSLGWKIERDENEFLDIECTSCQAHIPEYSLYCLQCGNRVLRPPTQSPIDDLEAAICAALQGDES